MRSPIGSLFGMGRRATIELAPIRELLANPRLRTSVVVFAAAIVAQLMFDAALPASFAANTSEDFRVFYLPVAENLRAGLGLTVDGAPATYWAPGYPVVLAGSFHLADLVGLSHDAAVHLVRLVAVGLGAVVLLALFERLFARRTAVLATAMWIVCPLNLFLGKQPNSELPFRVVLYGALLAYVVAVQRRRPEFAAAAGALVGLAALIRPAALLLGLVLAVPLVAQGARADRSLLRLAGVLIAVNVAVLVPHQLWLAAHTDRFALVSTSGTAAAVDGLTIGTDPDEVPVGGFSSGAVEIMQRASDRRAELTTYADVAAFIADAARDDPAGVANLIAVKAARAWYSTESGTGDVLAVLVQVSLLVAVAFGIRCARRSGQLDALSGTITIGVPLYFWAVTIAVLPLARQMVPSEALLFPFVAIAAERFVGWTRTGAPRVRSGQ